MHIIYNTRLLLGSCLLLAGCVAQPIGEEALIAGPYLPACVINCSLVAEILVGDGETGGDVTVTEDLGGAGSPDE